MTLAAGTAIPTSRGLLATIVGDRDRARTEEAGFVWPPQKPIDYPTKTW